MNACTRTSAVVTLIYLRILAIFLRWYNASLAILLIGKDIVTVLSKMMPTLRALFVGLTISTYSNRRKPRGQSEPRIENEEFRFVSI